MNSAVDLRRYYEADPRPCGDTDLACLMEGRRGVVGDPQRWFHLYFPAEPYREDLAILVAGCGDWETARLAAGAPKMRFLAVEDDERAFAGLDGLRRHYRLDNLDLARLRLDQAVTLDRRFDLIFCEDLAAENTIDSLTVLREVLAPSGTLILTVRGRHGRFALDLFSDLLKTAGVGPEGAGAARVREWLAALPPRHPFRRSAAASELDRDAGLAKVLRPTTPCFSVPELHGLLERAGLRFQRFLCQAPYLPQCSRLVVLPELLSRASALPLGQQAAVAELLRGSLTSHTVLACRDDRPIQSYAVDFRGDAWAEYIPIRNPGLAIETSPLAGSASALLHWGVHEDPEISVLVDEREIRLLDAIDGERTVAQILSASGWKSEPAAPARDFFASLWARDFVWFRFPSGSGAGVPH